MLAQAAQARAREKTEEVGGEDEKKQKKRGGVTKLLGMGKKFTAFLKQSYEIADAATSNWLSAVDMMADNTAASMTPAITGGSKSPAALNNTCSESPRSANKTRQDKPSNNMPAYTITAHEIAMTLPWRRLCLSFNAMKRLTTCGCPG